MSEIKTTVHVNVEQFDGTEADDVGYPYFVVNSPELHFTTDGKTFDELFVNIQECLRLCLADGDSIVEYSVAPDARVQVIFEIQNRTISTCPHVKN